MIYYTFLEYLTCWTYKAIAVIYFAERVYRIKLIQLFYCIIKLIQFSYVFDSIAYIHNPCMKKHTCYRDICIYCYTVAEASFTEMHRKKVAYISSLTELKRIHLTASEWTHIYQLSVHTAERYIHIFCISLCLIFLNRIKGIWCLIYLLSETPLPVVTQAYIKIIAIYFWKKFVYNLSMVFNWFAVCKCWCHTVQYWDMIIALLHFHIIFFLESFYILLAFLSWGTATAFRKYRICKHCIFFRRNISGTYWC